MLHHIDQRQKVIVMLAVMSAMFLVALDQTIISTALGRIVEEFKSFSSLSYVVTAYLLTSTVTVPIAGKMSDVFGRKKILLGGVVIFILGSLLSGSAATIDQLIWARAFQGIGGGVIMANAFTIIGDLFSPRERGKWQGLIGAVFGLSSVIGPLLGGFLTDPHTIFGLITNWRWTFLINVPIGLVSLAIIVKYLPRIRHDHTPTIDWLGAGFIALSLSSLILAVDNTEKIFATMIDGGVSLMTIRVALYGIFVLSTLAFIAVERRAKEPILPLEFFRHRTFTVLVIAMMLFGAAFLGSILYLTQFNQQVFGADATQSGLMLLPMIVGLSTTAATMGRFVSRTGRYKTPMIVGLSVATIGVFMLSFLTPSTPYWYEAIVMLAVGAGLGAAMPIFTLAVQNEFSQKDLGAATASVQLFRGLGSTVGTAVLGTMLITGVTNQLGSLSQDSYIQLLSKQPAAQEMLGKSITTDTALNLNMHDLKTKISNGVEASTQHLPAPLRDKVRNDVRTKQNAFSAKVVNAFSSSLRSVFYAASALLALAVLVVLRLEEKPLRGGHDDTPGVA